MPLPASPAGARHEEGRLTMTEEERVEREAVETTAVSEEPVGVPVTEPSADEQETMRRFEEEIRNLSVADHLVLMLHSLHSMAVERMGFVPEAPGRKDLEQARMAIDAFKALVGVLEGSRPVEEIAAHRSALSQLQMAFVAAQGGANKS
jgi:hypothetical protein